MKLPLMSRARPAKTARCRQTLTFILLASTLLTGTTAFAAVDDATLLKLIAQVEALTEKVNRLEQRDKELREENVALRKVASTPAPVNDKLVWAERVKINGDFRYRYENIDDAAKSQDRNRSRIRARIDAQAQVTDDWLVGLGLASGDDDPVSTNQTLGEGGSSKNINIDQAYFDWSGIAHTHVIGGSKPFFSGAAFGNSLVTDGANMVYANDYEQVELFAELAFGVAGLPASVFADWVQNQDADDNDTGWAIGTKLGAAKNPGSWQLGYTYQDLEADAVYGLITDSDFGGGGTNSKGHLIKATYAVDNNVALALAYYMNEVGDLETDFDRLQMDLKFKY